ncbi:MAG: cell surface protein SprA, partial [Nitrospiria bacterium]
MAVYLEITRRDSTVYYMGKLDYDTTKDLYDSARDTTNVLKLIKDNSPLPTHQTWDYEWKNVYYLGATNIDRDGFKLDIYKGKPDAENLQVDRNSQDTIPYIRILGLDRFDLSGAPKPDNLVDLSQIDLFQGYLYFPQLQPFAADTSYTGNMNDVLAIKIDTIYKTNILQDKNAASQYYIYFEGATRQTEYYLGRSPILEGSEVVTLNGRVLTRGVDYNIVYEIGQVIFLNQEILDPNAEVNIDYEYAPIFLPEKKTLFGIQGGQVFSSHFRMNFNALYSTEKSSETRPRVGQESKRNFVWDTNFGLDLSPAIMTKLTNALPFVQATAASKFQVSGEIAQSLPNPNIRNKVYIEDFEAVQDYTDLGIRRGTWTLTSPPDGKSLPQRGRLIWYNPWDQVVVQDIWPYRETISRESKVNILNLQLTPDSSLVIPDSSWGGIMRPIFGGSQNQTKTKYLEIWVKGNTGILKVDLGRVSEDIDQDGNPDTEDLPRNGIRDNILDDDEDRGLDTLLSRSEPGYDASNNPDPNGDDWDYTN